MNTNEKYAASPGVLLAAATVLRERATAALCRPPESRRWFDSSDDAAYVATVHPAVGLALADWLDATATEDQAPSRTGHRDMDAIIVAKTVLGLYS